MLRRLLIRDYAIVDRLELEFETGFGAVTGETGAGKSILVDALSLALGERADAGVVRSGCERAEVAAEFDVPPDGALETWLRENDFPSEDGVLLRRLVDAGGRSRAYVNGLPATVGQLRSAAEFLADIHGQHAHLSLMRPEAQRALLDNRAGVTTLVREVAIRYKHWRQLHEASHNAARNAEASARERDMLEFQVRELEALDVESGKWLEELAEHSRLTHAADLIQAVESALAVLDDAEISAANLIDRALAQLDHVVDHDQAMRGPVELLDGARIQLSEAIHAMSRYRERLDIDPVRLGELDARIEAVTGAARKHRVTPEALSDTLDEIRARLDELQLTSDPEILARREAEALAGYKAVAMRLSALRKKAAEELSAAVTEGMQQLAMVGGRFDVVLVESAEPTAHGAEDIEFLVAANAGQPPRSMAKVASGGELSRIGLAIQVVASCSGETPTLIFDEVDVGIGGGVAEIVGRLLKRLGQARQVLCVTHLPQVAACADWQWSITKETKAGMAFSRVATLDAESRVDEIARMLGGVRISDTTREHAKEMLDSGAV